MKWQYHGFGPNAGMHFPVMFDTQGKMVGFRGVYPVEINIPQKEGVKTTSLSIGSLYLVIPELRGKKLGLALQQFTQDYYGGYMAIGSNLGTSAPIYRKSGYLMLDQMHRYLVPFSEGYESLLMEPNNGYKNCFWRELAEEVKPESISPAELEAIWNNSPCSQLLSINKSKSFWEWRYLTHPVYKYYLFGGKDKGGAIVGRICHFYDEQGMLMDTTLFRILEVVPMENFSSIGGSSSKISILLKGALQWAKNQGCVGAEAYMTSMRFDGLLKNCGLYLLSEENKGLNIISNYEPITKSQKLTNVSIFVVGEQITDNFNDVYMSLADSDQDRPNIV